MIKIKHNQKYLTKMNKYIIEIPHNSNKIHVNFLHYMQIEARKPHKQQDRGKTN